MQLHVLLRDAEHDVLDLAYSTLQRGHSTHYETAGEAFTRDRLADLFRLVVAAIEARDLAAISSYATQVATERFNQGFDIAEVQAAFNALEGAAWSRVVADVPADELAEAIGLLSTVLGFGKDALAREYVELASRRHVHSLDLSALFAGAQT